MSDLFGNHFFFHEAAHIIIHQFSLYALFAFSFILITCTKNTKNSGFDFSPTCTSRQILFYYGDFTAFIALITSKSQIRVCYFTETAILPLELNLFEI